jgi:hypothetical protein
LPDVSRDYVSESGSSPLSILTGHLLAIKEVLAAADVRPDALLIEDLGLDSLDIAELAARIRHEFPDVDLMPWLRQAATGRGTVGSLSACIPEPSSMPIARSAQSIQAECAIDR